VGRDENVVGLEIAMDDEPRVSEGDGTRDLQEQLEPLCQRERVVRAIAVGRYAVDVFECEVRTALVIDTRIVEARDVWMLQRREDVALASDARSEPAIDEPEMRQLDGHLALQGSVRALSEPHDRRATRAELTHETIGPDEIPRLHLHRCRYRAELRQPPQEVAGLDGASIEQDFLERRAQVRMLGPERAQPLRALRRLEVERFIEQLAEPLPVDRIDSHG